MKALIDTNVVLDILLHRHPWYDNSAMIFGLADENLIKGYVPTSAITDIFYVSQKQLGKNPTKKALKTLLSVFKPAAVTDNHIYHALDLDWADFEDSVQYIVGISFSADYIITRNTQDFSSSSIPAVTPEQFINIVNR